MGRHGQDPYQPVGLEEGDGDDFASEGAAGRHIQGHTLRAKKPSPAILPAHASPL